MVCPPTQIRRLAPGAIDLAPCEAAARCRELPGLVFFDAALPGPNAVSLLAARPSFVLQGRTEADWTALRRAVAERQTGNPSAIPSGFAAGWIDYDGSFRFGFYDELLAFSHSDASWHASGNALRIICETAPGATRNKSPFSLPFTPTLTRERFTGLVRRAQEYIAAGDIYQVNLSHRFEAPWPAGADPFAFYQNLRACSPAPEAAFLNLGDRAVLSSSPELFLEIQGRHIRTRPIKGTRPRRPSPEADAASERDLLTSPKEAAELIMITDLERNDLGQVCEYGSVVVRELLKLERFEQVFHLISTVEGLLRPEVDAVAALRACFPGGSITGAPKKRAMEIIAALEPIPRGLYTGAIGWFGFNGRSRFSIAIRTAVIENGLAHFHAGAGIVADSIPDREWQETLDKASGILLAANAIPAR